MVNTPRLRTFWRRPDNNLRPIAHAQAGIPADARFMASTPRQAVSTIGVNLRLARGSDERFTGYGAMGVPFSGGHYLAFRDMLASSLGKTYRAIWHRDPAGRWTIFTTTDPDASCPRYFGSVTAVKQVPSIEVTWTDDWAVDVTMGARLSWRLRLGATPATRAMTSMGGITPQWAWNSDAVLGPMGSMAAGFLRWGGSICTGALPTAKASRQRHCRYGESSAATPNWTTQIWALLLRCGSRHVSATSGFHSGGCSSPVRPGSPHRSRRLRRRPEDSRVR